MFLIKTQVTLKSLIVICLLLLASLVQAQTPPSETSTLSPMEQIDRDATRILAGYTATAEAFPIAPEQTDDFAAATFGVAICSMLLVLGPLAFGLWRMNRSSP